MKQQHRSLAGRSRLSRLAVLVPCVAAAALALLLSGPATSAALHAQRSVVTSSLNAVTFVNRSHGCAVGAGGVILHTTNGGRTWKKQKSGTTRDLKSVAFANASHGWVVGGEYATDGIILATTNGGRTWKKQKSIAGFSLAGVAFASAKDGWAVGNDGAFEEAPAYSLVLHTTNGGATWKVRKFPYVLTGVACKGTRHMWACSYNGGASNGGVLLTTNGGATWKMHDSDTSDLMAVTFANLRDGWAVATDDTGMGAIFATTNGGTSWHTQVARPPDPVYGLPGFEAVTCVSAANVWVVGNAADEDGTILATTDGGANWEVQQKGLSNDLAGVTFANARDGWAVGDAGVLATTNGGGTWKKQ